MTENKRFHFGYVLGDTGLIDEQSTEHKWFIENCCSVSDLKKNWKTVCDKLNEVADENEQLKQQIKKLEAQLYKVEDGVCDICNNMYLVQQGRYFVSKCKKGHDECSKMDLDYCDDFELKGDVE